MKLVCLLLLSSFIFLYFYIFIFLYLYIFIFLLYLYMLHDYIFCFCTIMFFLTFLLAVLAGDINATSSTIGTITNEIGVIDAGKLTT